MEELETLLKTKDWFHSVGHDQFGRLVVYTKYMCPEAYASIPDRIAGNQVLIHFAASLLANKEKFANIVHSTPNVAEEPTLQEEMDSLSDVDIISTYSLFELTNELDKLEKICGSNILQDIFFEIHDGNNAVTNLSNRYPEVRDRLISLYQQYGFDIIYEELDG